MQYCPARGCCCGQSYKRPYKGQKTLYHYSLARGSVPAVWVTTQQGAVGMLVLASSCPNYFILHITSILLVGTDGQYLAPCPATVGRAPDVFLLQTASWTRNRTEWRASITLGMEVPQAQVLIAINILTVLNHPTFLGYLPLYHVSGQSWLTDKATDTGSETSGVVQETRKIWFEAPSAGISTDMGELTDDPDSDSPDLQPLGELDKGLLMSPVSTTLLCGFCFHSQHQSRFYPLQAEF